MGLGSLKTKLDWPEEVKLMKTVVLRGFEQVLFSWQSRQLETLSQRVQVARTFALSKLYYITQVPPLTGEHRGKVEE